MIRSPPGWSAPRAGNSPGCTPGPARHWRTRPGTGPDGEARPAPRPSAGVCARPAHSRGRRSGSAVVRWCLCPALSRPPPATAHPPGCAPPAGRRRSDRQSHQASPGLVAIHRGTGWPVSRLPRRANPVPPAPAGKRNRARNISLLASAQTKKAPPIQGAELTRRHLLRAFWALPIQTSCSPRPDSCRADSPPQGRRRGSLPVPATCRSWHPLPSSPRLRWSTGRHHPP
ncbi:hypothetical protein D3C85_661890 [compost metagenome]